VVHHQGREHDIERLIGEREALDYPNLKLDGRMSPIGPGSFRAGAGDLLCAWINAEDATRNADAGLGRNRQRTCAAAHIQRCVSRLKAGQVERPPPEPAQLATKQERIEEPFHQVIAPALIEDQPFCRSGWRGARFLVMALGE
jgi:hypothetical protein